MSFFNELKRRNVIRVAAGYIVLAWLLIQVAGEILPPFGVGDNIIRLIIIGFAIGFVPVVVVAWAFELTPEGLQRDSEVVRDRPALGAYARRWDRVVMVVLAVAVAFFVFDKYLRSPPAPRVPTIAVLPFENLSSDPEQAYFGDGIAEEILNLLAAIPQLHVTSRTSSFHFAQQSLSTIELAETLDVAHILEGSIRKSGNEIRITAQLIDARSDKHLWSNTFDRPLHDIFDIQDEIAAEIVSELHLELVGPLPSSTRTDPAVLALTIQAKQVFHDTSISGSFEGAGDKMAALLDAALEIDPNYAPAIAWYSYANWLRRSVGQMSLEEDNRRFDELAARALLIDPEQPIILQLQAWREIFENVNPERAAELYLRALRAAPNDSEVLRNVARFAWILGHHEDSLALSERAVALDPLCRWCLYHQTRAYMVAGDYDKALESRERWLLLANTEAGGLSYYGDSMLLKGDAEAALRIYEQMLAKNAEPQALPGVAMAQHSLGRFEESDAALAAAIDGWFNKGWQDEDWGSTVPDGIAFAYAWRGDRDEAFEWLNVALDIDLADPTQTPNRVTRLNEPLLKNLHDDPRWEEFRVRTGLPSERIAAIEFDIDLPPRPRSAFRD